MLPDPLVLAVAIPAVMFAGVSKGGFGSGAAFAAAPLLALVVEPAIALGIMLPLLMLMDVMAVRTYWGRWHPPSARALIWGGLPGVALGALLFRLADPDVFRFLIGGIALAFVVFQVARSQRWLRVPNAPFSALRGAITGAAAGFTSFISHAGGPPVAVFLLSQGVDKTTYQATTVVVFWVINLFKAVPYAFLGFFTLETLVLNLWLLPAAVAGVWIGIRAHRMVPERVFFGITYVLLTATGLKLIHDALF